MCTQRPGTCLPSSNTAWAPLACGNGLLWEAHRDLPPLPALLQEAKEKGEGMVLARLKWSLEHRGCSISIHCRSTSGRSTGRDSRVFSSQKAIGMKALGEHREELPVPGTLCRNSPGRWEMSPGSGQSVPVRMGRALGLAPDGTSPGRSTGGSIYSPQLPRGLNLGRLVCAAARSSSAWRT